MSLQERVGSEGMKQTWFSFIKEGGVGSVGQGREQGRLGRRRKEGSLEMRWVGGEKWVHRTPELA